MSVKFIHYSHTIAGIMIWSEALWRTTEEYPPKVEDVPML